MHIDSFLIEVVLKDGASLMVKAATLDECDGAYTGQLDDGRRFTFMDNNLSYILEVL